MIVKHDLEEQERLDYLYRLNLLDTLPEGEFDMLTKLASKLLNVPVSLISIVDSDRQWFKSKVGVELCETPRNISFCSHAILQPELMVVENADEDERFANNPLVTAEIDPIKFYSGIPILLENKYPVGTLCIIDYKPRKLDEEQKEILTILGKQVERLLELRLVNLRVKEQQQMLEKQHERLKDFAGVISHDMKMPLANIIITSDILKLKYSKLLDEQGVGYLEYLKNSSLTLSNYINNILEYYQTDNLAAQQKEAFDIYELLEGIIEMLQMSNESQIILPEENLQLVANKPALEQVFLNLMTNALKYNDKEIVNIKIDSKSESGYYYFTVEDNGTGISKDKLTSIFELYETLGNKDRYGQTGHGIGLSMVQNICQALGGDIKVTSEVGKGSCFKFWVKW